MKKIFAIVAVLLTLSATIFIACQKEKSGCKTCKISNNYQLLDIKISNIETQVKNYSGLDSKDRDEATYSFSYKEDKDLQPVINVLNRWGLSSCIPKQGTDTSLVSIVLYINKEISKNPEIGKEDVYGLLIYYRIKDQMRTKTYSFANSGVIKNEDLSTITSVLSSNDIYSISKLLQTKQSVVSSIAFINFKNIINSEIIHSPLQRQIRKSFTNKLRPTISDGGGRYEPPVLKDHHICGFPCTGGFKGYCVAHEGQNGPESWYCIPSEGCEKTEANGLLAQNNITFDFAYQDNMLRNFADSFLINSVKGQWYIETYYSLSSKFNNDNTNIGYFIQAFNVIDDDVIPLMTKLLVNPNSDSVLFDSGSAARMVSFCEASKAMFSDSDSKGKIQQIINDINSFANKKVSEIDSKFQ